MSCDAALAGAAREVVRIDAGPDGAARAHVTAPALLGIADHRHATRWWRDLRIDESVSGLAAQRARPSAIVIEHRGDRWPLPVRGLLGCGLAWSPLRPLVAGLAVRGGRAHPWIADYAERTVRTFDHVRAATSLTALHGGGGSPLCWLGERTLGVLAAPPRRAPGPPRDEPVVCEAAGPGFVSFEPGLDELLAAAGAAIALLDTGDAAVDALTGPLLVGRLSRAADGEAGLVVRHAAGLRDGPGSGGRGLFWSAARLDLATRPATLEPCEEDAAVPAARIAPAAHGAQRPSSSVRMLPAPAPRQRARLALFPAPSADARMATLLWIRAARGPLDPARPIAAPLPDAGTPVALLDLALRWPGDATLARLRRQIVGAVRAAVEALGGERIVVGGHSFGATLALFALARVPGLAGGIAHSGCYNRTLTPFGFHYERRRYWDVPEIYEAFSALAFADRIRAPVLIVHGLEDANAATHPDQAAGLYRAIVATGGTARLVLLPREEHNFRYRETHARLERIHRDWLERAAAAAPDGRGGDTTRHAGAVRSHA